MKANSSMAAIPELTPDLHADGGGCSAGESFALRVLGSDMAPEFNDGDIIIVEPDGALVDGCFVLAQVSSAAHEEWLLRQLLRSGAGWRLHALNGGAAVADTALPDLQALRGRVIQKAVPGRRRLSKSYL